MTEVFVMEASSASVFRMNRPRYNVIGLSDAVLLAPWWRRPALVKNRRLPRRVITLSTRRMPNGPKAFFRKAGYSMVCAVTPRKLQTTALFGEGFEGIEPTGEHHRGVVFEAGTPSHGQRWWPALFSAERLADADYTPHSQHAINNRLSAVQYCHSGYKSDEDGEDEFTNGVDICGDRETLGLSVIGNFVVVAV